MHMDTWGTVISMKTMTRLVQMIVSVIMCVLAVIAIGTTLLMNKHGAVAACSWVSYIS